MIVLAIIVYKQPLGHFNCLKLVSLTRLCQIIGETLIVHITVLLIVYILQYIHLSDKSRSFCFPLNILRILVKEVFFEGVGDAVSNIAVPTVDVLGLFS